MHELSVLYSNWSPIFYAWARTAIAIVLWFWVISGALFALRFLVFVALDRSKRSSPLTASPAVLSFPPDRFTDEREQSTRISAIDIASSANRQS